MGLINGSENNDEQEEDPNLQSFLTPYSPSFFLPNNNGLKNKTIKSIIEESLKENIDNIDIKQVENDKKVETTPTEAKEKVQENINKINNSEDNNNVNNQINEKNNGELIGSNNKDRKNSSNNRESNIEDEPLKYKSSSLHKDIRNFYKFKDFLGEGHFGSVRTAFKRREYSPHKLFAVKSISLKKLSEEAYNNLIKEVKIISCLEHPHIVKFYETYHDDIYFHIVTELCRGNNLYMRTKKLKGKKMIEEDAKIIVFKLLHAINYCHSKGVVHRDLKPENIIFESPNNDMDYNEYVNDDNIENYLNVKICDFGLSALKNSSDNLHTILGTPYYMAPEVLKGDYNEKCDIWSIGAITYYLITGIEPFRGDTSNQIFSRILYTEPDYSLSKFWNNSPILLDFLKKCFLKEPLTRPTAKEALEHPWFENIFKKIHSPKFIGDEIFYNISTTKKFSQLKRLIMRYMVYTMGHTELNIYKNAFLWFDKDSNGNINPEELKRLFEVYDKSLTEKQIKNIMTVSDERNEYLTYNEFIIICLNVKDFLSPIKLLDAFLFFDVNNDNEIDNNDLYLALLRWGKDVIDKDMIEKIIFLGTKKKYKKLDLKAFVEIFEDEIDVNDFMNQIEEIKIKNNKNKKNEK